MKKLLLSSFTIIFLIAGEFIFAQNSGISIKFCTVGQQYGVADLDKFSLAKGKDGTGLFYSREMENPNSSSVGMPVFRSNASNVRAWGQFGCYDGSYNPASGCVLYENIQGTYGKNYLQIRYSKWGYSSIPIKIYINDIYQTEFIPVDQGNWNIFTQTPWLEITLPCVLPVANAGSDKTYKKDATISLDGSGSSIGNGDRIIYHWQSLDGISLNNESSATPSFIASSKGNYKFVLWVENGCSNSVKDTVLINVVENMKPFANAGSDQYVYEGDIVRLSSSRSYDTNHDALTFLWSAPNTIILNDNHIADPFFTAPTLNVDTSYTLALEANNGYLSSTAKVTIHVLVKKPATNEAYYHPFQNWDDDVDRIKTYSNALGGDNGVMNGDKLNPQIILSYDTLSTRSGFGRALKIQYKQLKGWSGYVESFNKKWYSDSSYTNLNNLFPDYIDPRFQNRKIDSIAFYYKLKSEKDLFLKAELHDSFGNISDFTFRLPPGGDNWQKKSIALKDFIDNKGKFIPEFAKYIMFVFADYPNNINKSGDLFLDDLYLVENNFQKPSFSNKDEQLSYLNEVNFRHMWEAVDPRSKFALDRHTWLDLISVDAIGFQLSSYAIAHKRGWINPDTIERRVENIITWLVDSCNHTSSLSEISANPLKYASYKGNWSHFLDNKTLARKNTSTEFSVFSDALLMAGVLAAKEYFSWNINIATKADKLYRMTDWKFFYKAPDTLRYSWSPELGYQGVADWFTEELDLAFLLGISTPVTDFRLPVNIFKSKIYNKPYCNCNGYIYSAPGANFTYYFLQMYARFNETSKRFINTKNAFLADIDFSKGFLKQMDYNALIYGHTACEGPDSAGVGTQGNISNYHAYGIENGCRYDKENKPNGTIAVYGSGAGMLFVPEETNKCIDYYYNDLDKEFLTKYNYNFWSPIFGFPDAFHLSPDKSSDITINNLHFRGPWLSVPRFGIDVGPMLMNMDSYLAEKNGDQSLRDLFSNISYLKSNIDSFEFDSLPVIKPNPPTIGATTHPTCAVPTGSVVLNGLPATGTWTLTRTPGAVAATGTGTSSTISGLASGTYTFTVTNTTGCVSSATANVVINAQPVTPTAPIVGTITQPTCAISTGSVELNGLPATGTWTLILYSIHTGPGFFGITQRPTIGTWTLGSSYDVFATTGTGTTSTISGLANDKYTFWVTNTSGCTSPGSGSVDIHAQPVIPTFGSITGSSTVCQGQSDVIYSVSDIESATTYLWTLPTGSTETSTTNSISVGFGATAVSGNVTVKGQNDCGDGVVSTLAISVNPLPEGAGKITGSATVCQGQSAVVYTVPTIANATSYVWTLPTGATGTSTTNNITISYGAYAVSGNITVKGQNTCGDGVESTLAISVNQTCNGHFTPVWIGNGVDQMNINIYSAKFDGVDLEAGDEIGIFDGANCVGVGILTGTLSQANTLDIIVSRNDGYDNGYTTGNAITYKLFDKSKELENSNLTVVYANEDPFWSTDGKFSVGVTAFASLTGVTKVIQEIPLITGWNIISFNVVPSNLDLKVIFQSFD